MNEPIQVGDLVYCYRDCCGQYIGTIFVVERTWWGIAFCGQCWRAFNVGVNGTGSAGNISETIHCLPVNWLRRIPPLPELVEEHDRVPVRETELVNTDLGK